MGGEYYDETVRSTREDRSWDAATGDYTHVRQSRGRYPDGAGYGTSGFFVQDVAFVVPNRVVVNGAVRYSRFSYSQSAADNPVGNGVPTVSDYSTAFDDVTFNAGVVVAVNTALNLTANVARGFRAPNVSDLGAVGVTGGGFEVSPEEAIRVGASVVPYGAATATGALPAAPKEIAPRALVQDSNGAVREIVASDPDAVGYISLGLVDARVRAVSIEGVAPSREAIRAGRYAVARPFLFLCSAEPAGTARAFIDFVLSPAGQEELAREGLVAVGK